MFSIADLELEGTLDNLDDADNYAGWIFGLMKPYLGEAVLEVGAGHGTFTEILASQATRVVASDLSGRCAAVLAERFATVPNVEIIHGGIEACASGGPFDTAVLVNVLEHIEGDDAALVHLSELLTTGGRLILWVPAFAALYSEFDRKVGHFRRYQLARLKSQLVRAGYMVEEIRYANSIGVIAWWVVACLLRRTPTGRSSVQAFDRYLVPVVKWLESKRRPPFGQSIFAVAIRPPEPNRPLEPSLTACDEQLSPPGR